MVCHNCIHIEFKEKNDFPCRNCLDNPDGYLIDENTASYYDDGE